MGVFGTTDLDNDIEDQAALPVTRLLNLAPPLDDVVGMRLQQPGRASSRLFNSEKIYVDGYGQAADITVNSTMLCRYPKILKKISFLSGFGLWWGQAGLFYRR